MGGRCHRGNPDESLLIFALGVQPDYGAASDLNSPRRPTIEINLDDQRQRVGEVDQDEPVASCPGVGERVIVFRYQLSPAKLATFGEVVEIYGDQPTGFGLEIGSQKQCGASRAG